MTHTIHFGLMPSDVDAGIGLGMSEPEFLKLGSWNPPIITHGDDWEDWNEEPGTVEGSLGAIHMCFATDDPIRGVQLVQEFFDAELIPMTGEWQHNAIVCVSERDDWSEEIRSLRIRRWSE